MTCSCDRCMKKTPREGFFKASPGAHQAATALQNDLDYWMESRVGYDPKTGRPDLDNTFERERTPSMLQALLAKIKARYPRAYRMQAHEFEAPRAKREYPPSDPVVLAEYRDRLASKIQGREGK